MRRRFSPRSGRGVFLASALCLACGFFSAAVQAVQGARIPPPPARWATDEAGFISPAVRAEIDFRLESFERETGRQVLLYISRTTGDVPLEDFAARVFGAWKVGRKGMEDGLVLFLFADDRAVRIEVGYGLEGVVTDAIAGRVIQNILIPGIRRGDPDGAVRAAVTALLETISGKPAAEPGETESADKPAEGEIPAVFLIIAGVLFLILLITNPRLALFLLYTLLSGGGGRGGGGGGGFRGGGGRSGGGGASGRW